MARIRTIKPELPQDETLGRCSLGARYLFVTGLTLADDFGRMRAAPAVVRGQLFAYDDEVSVADVGQWLQELADAGRLELYEVEGQKYARYSKWAKHQRVDNAGRPLYPPSPAEVEAGIGDKPVTNVEKNQQRRAAASCGDPPLYLDLDLDLDHDQEGTTIGASAKAQPGAAVVGAQDAGPPGFRTFIGLWPADRRVQIPSAKRAWGRALRKAPADVILRGAGRWARYWALAGKPSEFIPTPTRWLNDERWNDPTPTTNGANGRSHSAELKAAIDTFMARRQP